MILSPLSCLWIAALWEEPILTSKWELSHGKIQATPRATEPEPDPLAATPAAKKATGNVADPVMDPFSLFSAACRHFKPKPEAVRGCLCFHFSHLYKAVLPKVGLLIDSCLFTHLFGSKQREPVFNAGKKRLLYGSYMCLWVGSRCIKDAQWFSVSVGGQRIVRNPVKIQSYGFTFCLLQKEAVTGRPWPVFCTQMTTDGCHTMLFNSVFIFLIFYYLTSNKPLHPSLHPHLHVFICLFFFELFPFVLNSSTIYHLDWVKVKSWSKYFTLRW